MTSSFSSYRRLRVEWLEDRHLLSITVNTLVDEADGSIVDGDISLRDAIAGAAQGETIDFSVTGRINLTLGQITINKSLTVTGPGANLLTIDASGNDPTPDQNNGDGSRIFSIDDANVAISGLTLTGGDVADGGGAIRSVSSTLMVSNSRIDGNSATGDGGGILSGPFNMVTITHTTISGNSATGNGGGIENENGVLAVVDSTISGNSAGRRGGGISTSRIGLFATQPRIVNSTVSGNTAGESGGGIYSNSGHTIVRHSTITGNSAPNGGGVGSSSYSSRPNYPGSRIDVYSTIIAGNANSDLNYAPRAAAKENPFRSNGYNLVGTGDGTIAFVEPGDQTGVMNSMLDPLANNGGPTKTHALLTGSPAINAGDPGAVPSMSGVPEFDQRGAPFTRVSGRIDIGSNEHQPIPPAVFGDYNQSGVVDAADYVVWRKSLNQSVTPFGSADGDGDGMVDGDDYGIWRAHFGQMLPPPTAVSAALDSLAAADSAGQASSGNHVGGLAGPSADLLQPLAVSAHGAARFPVAASAISPLRAATALDVAEHKGLLLACLSILRAHAEEQFNVPTISARTDDGLANRSDPSLDAFDKVFELVGNPGRFL